MLKHNLQNLQDPPQSRPAARPAPLRALRVIRFLLWGLLLATMAGVIGVKYLTPKASTLPVLFPAAEFNLTDQDSMPISSQSLRGRPWAAAFIFTRCPRECPRMTANMAAVQKKLPDEVTLVSFSVDPENDTPAVLKGYAGIYHADESRWRFVTGPKDTIMQVIKQMKLAFQGADARNPILHSEKLLLVDAEGQIRGAYESTDPEEMKRFANDAAALTRDANRGPIGRFFARLNAASNRSNNTNGPSGRGGPDSSLTR